MLAQVRKAALNVDKLFTGLHIWVRYELSIHTSGDLTMRRVSIDEPNNNPIVAMKSRGTKMHIGTEHPPQHHVPNE